MATPIRRQRIVDQVLDQLKDMIAEGEFPPDSKLPSETELAAMFEVSRAPIREALSVLAAMGLIESKQGGASKVLSSNVSSLLEKVTLEMVDIDQILHLLEVRTTIETEAAALAAIRYNDDDLAALDFAFNQFREDTLVNKNIGDKTDFLFHHEIVKASHNPILLQTIEGISTLYQKSLKHSLKLNIGKDRKRTQVVKEHEEIFTSIKERDGEKAHKAMKIHLENVRSKFI